MSIFFKMYQIILCAVVMAAPVGAQGLGAMFSPGELSASHTKLEGLKNCTKCHSILGGIGDSNCLKCHEKLTARIRAKKGFHAQVKKRCISCHSDHKGKSYEMVQFDKEEFDHGKTGYELKEKHKVACKKCHKDEEKTYLGLSEKCISCHEDIHENELGQSCLKCHSLEGWKQLVFEHNRDSAFSLLGKHIPVQCEKCHKESSYKVPNYTLCITCHLKDDKHKGKPGKECTKCHSEVGWKKLHTDHSKTAYPLIGKHKTVECRKCHINGALKIKKFTSCDSGLCHKDIHKMQFTPVPCKGCHTEKRWKPSTFFHESPSYSGYKLIGAHKKVECAKCHKGGVYKPVEYTTCDSIGCHADPHNAQFAGQSCTDCHSEKGWKPSMFFHESPLYSGYKLIGAHEKVECAKCHKAGLYKPVEYGTCDSSGCHADPHKAQFVDQSCSSCHIEKEWKPSIFSHESVSYGGYKLLGAHEKVECAKCHKAGAYKPVEYGTCDSSGCHADPHKAQFVGQSCSSCHVEKTWKPSTYSHESLSYDGYKLKGAHKNVECVKCHKNGLYKPIEYRTCDSSSCHIDPHKAQFVGQSCSSCHIEKEWKPSTFFHGARSYGGYKLTGAHEKVDCVKCHKAGLYKPVEYKTCDSSGCHRDIHEGQFKRSCKSCHSEKSWSSLTFDHQKESSYPLTGKHREIECKKCHSGKTYSIQKKECVSCHKDIHEGRFEGACDTCHTTYNWKPKASSHEKTGFPLKGVHKQIECSDCHKSTTNGYRETSPLCTSCHKDPHFNQFGDSCDSCHTEYEWFPFRFNHNETGLPLRGVHRVIDCEKCHRNREYRNSSVPDNCFGCHEAAFSRASNHVAKAYSRDCLTCHESFVAWFFKHNLSLVCSDCHFDRFQSAPDHLNKSFSTACTDCHRSTTAWVFSHNSVPDNCASCHLNRKPQSHFSKNWSVCEECHNSKSTWRSAHPATSFPLNHRGTNPADCDACHPAENYQNSGGCIECHNSSGAEVHETTINSQCLSCHPFGQED